MAQGEMGQGEVAQGEIVHGEMLYSPSRSSNDETVLLSEWKPD